MNEGCGPHSSSVETDLRAVVLLLCAQVSNSTAAEPSSVECFTAEHWPYAVPGIILLVVFVVLSARLMSVGGELASIEMTANPLNWRGDTRKQKAYVHPPSPRNSAHATIPHAPQTVPLSSPPPLVTQLPATNSVC